MDTFDFASIERKTTPKTGADLIVDGRTARRNSNRDRVLDALISLGHDGIDDPSVDAIAERAGVSYRSVYRYFDDRTDLMLCAIRRIIGGVWRIFEIEDLGEGPLEQRITRFTSARVAAYRQLAPLTRVAIRRTATESTVSSEYDNVRSYMRKQLEAQFAPELEQLDDAERALTVATLNVMFQFEAFEFLALYDQLTDEAMAEILERHLRAQLVACPLVASSN
ncbi:MAG: TetR/AcrR family transcriptional regulator [Ilumatobacteraceae bacterium]